MNYEGIDYVVRASLGRDQWTLLIYFSDNATVVKFSGTRDEACAAARRRIDGWVKRQRLKQRVSLIAGLMLCPSPLPHMPKDEQRQREPRPR